jgi:MFS superfamily sulfate permease-like transporter
MEITVFDIILGVAVGLLFSWMLFQFLVIRAMLRFERTVSQALQRQDVNQSIVEARADMVRDTFYIYATDDGRFLAQGTTAQEILDHISLRPELAGVKIVVSHGEQDVLDKLRAFGA